MLFLPFSQRCTYHDKEELEECHIVVRMLGFWQDRAKIGMSSIQGRPDMLL